MPNPPLQQSVEFWNQRGIDLARSARWAEAIDAFKNVLKSGPAQPGTYLNLGHCQLEAGQLDDAIASYRTATTFKPAIPGAFCDLGNALKSKGRIDEAIDSYRRCISLQPAHEEAVLELGRALRGKLDGAAAADVYRKAIVASPDFALAHVNLGHTLLQLGQFREGWHEMAWQEKVIDSSKRVSLPQPKWDGTHLAGKTILLYTEQGFGDAIQFVRYAPLVAQRGGTVLLGCFRELVRLFQTVPGIERIIANGQPLPQFDVHRSIQDLPQVFDTQLNTVPANIPYLSCDAESAARWQKRLAATGEKLKVGLAWAGNPKKDHDVARSVSLSMLQPLARVPGIEFFSLQKGAAAIQTSNPPTGMNLTDWTSELADFADTAALVTNVDLVICVDTAVAHLAGAMGKPVWMLAFTPSDWRWLLDREDSPWYPTLRLFRQPRAGDWNTPIARVADALAELAAGRRRE